MCEKLHDAAIASVFDAAFPDPERRSTVHHLYSTTTFSVSRPTASSTCCFNNFPIPNSSVVFRARFLPNEEHIVVSALREQATIRLHPPDDDKFPRRVQGVFAVEEDLRGLVRVVDVPERVVVRCLVVRCDS